MTAGYWGSGGSDPPIFLVSQFQLLLFKIAHPEVIKKECQQPTEREEFMKEGRALLTKIEDLCDQTRTSLRTLWDHDTPPGKPDYNTPTTVLPHQQPPPPSQPPPPQQPPQPQATPNFNTAHTVQHTLPPVLRELLESCKQQYNVAAIETALLNNSAKTLQDVHNIPTTEWQKVGAFPKIGNRVSFRNFVQARMQASNPSPADAETNSAHSSDSNKGQKPNQMYTQPPPPPHQHQQQQNPWAQTPSQGWGTPASHPLPRDHPHQQPHNHTQDWGQKHPKQSGMAVVGKLPPPDASRKGAGLEQYLAAQAQQHHHGW
eukprot:TRINITY_DN67835_c8_g13_i1.p2 TRINITY_DN67835_c8_g13~~TRINITY_DN67835_c8_g13_i1.p2  ORF type:complete len:326 (+),score=51.53 TRINITY_DN67835_c8_g13_i1:31-978(+)